MTGLVAVINYEEFYGKPAPSDPFEVISSYPTDVVLLVLCRVNATLFHEKGETYECQTRIFREIFNHLDKERRSLVAQHYFTRSKDNNGEGPVFFSDQAVTWLIGHCFRNYVPIPEGYEFDEAPLQALVFDSILTANKTYFEGQETYELDTYESIWYLVLKQQLYVRNVGPMMKDGAIKIHMFRNFLLNQHSEGRALIKEFKNNLGLSGFFDYASVYLGTIRNLFNTYRETQKISWLLNIEPSHKKLIETFALRPGDIPSKGFQGLYGSVIPKPVYFILNTHAVIIDYNFLGFLINTGFAYNFYKYTSLSKKSWNDYKGFLGKEFYETFVAGKILASLFSRFTFFSGNQLNEFADFAAVKDEKEIFLFEVKSTNIHFSVLEDVNVEKFKEYIVENFLQQKAEHSKNKGVYQLVKAIEQLSNGNLFPTGSTIKNLRNCKIYPIIIYTEPVLDTHGVNSFCNDHFQEAVSGLKSNFNHIYPLTMINLDFFLSYYPQLKKSPSLFPKLIKEYQERVSSGLRSAKRSNSPHYFLNANTAFTYFIYRTQPDPGSAIRQISDDLNLGYGTPEEEE